MKRWAALAASLLVAWPACWAGQRYEVRGIVLQVDRQHGSFVASCQSIPGYMEAMTMPFAVRHADELNGLTPGTTVTFSLVVKSDSSYAERIQIRPYEGVEQDPLIARRLKLLDQLSQRTTKARALDIDQTAPDFTLTDQNRHNVSLSQFAGRVVAINFIYTSCALPNYCFRITNNFGALQRRFHEELGRELVLLTVTFDPQRDGPEALARYAKTWKADAETWHFLTGSVADVRRVTDLFGVDYFPDEGLMNHSLHTAILDRQGKLIANLEGNQFTADQLGDLVQTVLSQRDPGEPAAQAHLNHPEKTNGTLNHMPASSTK